MRRILTIAVLMSFALGALAMPNHHAPFEPEDTPAPFPVCVWTNDVRHRGDDGRDVYYRHVSESPASFPRVSIESHESGKEFAVLELSPTQAVSRVELARSAIHQNDLFVVDLNGDKTDDFVLRTWSGGCGLAAEISYLTVFLSGADSYSGTRILGFAAEPSDIVDLNKDGQPELIHTVFVYGEKGKDGRSHNYWVHNLLGFSGTNVVSRNSLTPRFPSWVWYTFGPNHKNTTQLTGDQKSRLWQERWESYRGNMFPHVERFAEEQDNQAIDGN